MAKIFCPKLVEVEVTSNFVDFYFMLIQRLNFRADKAIITPSKVTLSLIRNVLLDMSKALIIYIYIYTYIHTYIHTYIYTCMG